MPVRVIGNSFNNKQRKYPPYEFKQKQQKKISIKRLKDNHNSTMTGKNLTQKDLPVNGSDILTGKGGISSIIENMFLKL